MNPMSLQVASTLMDATVIGGASRQAASAVTAALLRMVVVYDSQASVDPIGDDTLEKEVEVRVDERIGLIRPAITSQVRHGVYEGENHHTRMAFQVRKKS